MLRIVCLLLLTELGAGATTQAVMAQASATGNAPKIFVTRHKGIFGGSPVSYTATAGETFITSNSDAAVASIFTVAYTKEGVIDLSHRPVTFLFNGGPGSSAVWLHMGAFGPRRIEVPSDAQNAGLAPYLLSDNPSSLLDVTDLVFVDPVGTGFSHSLGSAKDEDFWSLIRDADSVSKFIRNWLVRNHRENSPKYLLGESYGSVRAAVVIRDLSDDAPGKITLNGLMLVGQDLDTTETQQAAGNDMPFVIYLPTYAATAWYYGKVEKTGHTFEAFLQEARDFARTDYQAALFLGSTISTSERQRIAARVAAFIGLPQMVIERENLRIGTAQYLRELLKNEGKVLIRMDTRYSIASTESVNYRTPTGVNLPGIGEAFAAVGSEYLRRELGVNMEHPYSVLAEIKKWDYTLPDGVNNQQTYHNVAPYVATAMRANPDMRMFVGSGYYDMLAAFFSMERTVSHSGLPLDRITTKSYPSGHMIYLNKSSLEHLSADLRQFITGSSR